MDIESLFDQAYQAHEASDFHAAWQGYRSILQAQPGHTPALYLSALIAQKEGHFDEAIALLQRYLALCPNDPDAFFEVANSCHYAGREAEAMIWIDQAIQVEDANPDYHCNRGLILRGLNRIEEAIVSYQRALQLDSDDADVWYNLANAYQQQGQVETAVTAYRETLKRQPDHGGALNNLGLLLHKLGQFSLALASFEKAIAVAPNDPVAYCNAASYFDNLGQPAKAVAYYEKALALCAGRSELAVQQNQAREDYALALMSLNRLGEAEVLLRGLIAEREDKTSATFNLGLCLLRRGDWLEGWACYEARHAPNGVQAHYYRRPASSRWHGHESLADKTVLVQSEQGLGDLIQFSRYLPLLSERGARVLVQAPETLQGLLACCLPNCRFLMPEQEIPAHDFHIPILSLPGAFETTPENVPPPLCFKAEILERIEGNFPRIGLVWSGNARHTNDRNRSLPLEVLLPVCNSIAANWYCLQDSIRRSDRATLDASSISVINFANFMATASLIEQLDLVISVDTSVAHLAASMGKEVFLLLPFAPDFRWLLDRTDSPWYSSLRLFRQTTPGDWSAVVEAVCNALQNKFCHGSY